MTYWLWNSGIWGIPNTIKNVAACARIYWATSIKVYRNVALQDLTPIFCNLFDPNLLRAERRTGQRHFDDAGDCAD